MLESQRPESLPYEHMYPTRKCQQHLQMLPQAWSDLHHFLRFTTDNVFIWPQSWVLQVMNGIISKAVSPGGKLRTVLDDVSTHGRNATNTWLPGDEDKPRDASLQKENSIPQRRGPAKA